MHAIPLHFAVSEPKGKRAGKMGVLTIRNVDDDLIVALKARAKANHRSLEGELRYLLSRYAVRSSGLGAVRERARIATAYKGTPDVRRPARGAGDDVVDTSPDATADTTEWLGAMRDVGEIVGDIVSPAADLSDWDVMRPDAPRPRDVDSQ